MAQMSCHSHEQELQKIWNYSRAECWNSRAVENGNRDSNYLFLQSLYILKKAEVQAKNDEEIHILLEWTSETKIFPGMFQYYRKHSTKRGFQEGERVREHFPTSTKVLKIVANLNKWKVFLMKDDSEEMETLARKSTELFEEVVRHYPDRLKVKFALHHCTVMHTTQRKRRRFTSSSCQRKMISLKMDNRAYIIVMPAIYIILDSPEIQSSIT